MIVIVLGSVVGRRVGKWVLGGVSDRDVVGARGVRGNATKMLCVCALRMLLAVYGAAYLSGGGTDIARTMVLNAIKSSCLEQIKRAL